jgi:hypothetical protein
LRREHSERKAGIDQLGGQPIDRLDATLDHLAEADLLGMADPLLDGGERAAIEEIGRVHGVPGKAQFVGERNDAGCQPQRVVKEHNFSHPYTVAHHGNVLATVLRTRTTDGSGTSSVLGSAVGQVCCWLRSSR